MLGFLTVEAASLPAFGGGLRGGEGSGGVPRRAHVGPQPPNRQLPPPLGPRRRQRRSGRAARQEVTPEGYCAPIPSGGGSRKRGAGGAAGAAQNRRKILRRAASWAPRAIHAALARSLAPPRGARAASVAFQPSLAATAPDRAEGRVRAAAGRPFSSKTRRKAAHRGRWGASSLGAPAARRGSAARLWCVGRVWLGPPPPSPRPAPPSTHLRHTGTAW